MYPALKERFIEIAEEDGWLKEWGEKRDMKTATEIARNLLALGSNRQTVGYLYPK